MPYLIRVSCPNCGRAYRYLNSAPHEETLCPFADCALIEDAERDSVPTIGELMEQAEANVAAMCASFTNEGITS